MKAYAKQQEMIDSVCQDLLICSELIGEKDESKKRKYGFVPGMESMQNQVLMLEDQVHKLRQGIFQVLFTGAFSGGKSTLLNALMRRDVLRMSIKAETAVITKIIFNEEEKVIVYKKKLDEDGQKLQEEYTIKEFFEKFRVSQDEADRFTDVDYVQLQLAQDGIGGSLVQLVDSPGIGNSLEDTEMARNFAKKASAVVYLINATKPFEMEDKEYIKEHYALKEMRNLYFVINRFDSVQPGEVDTLKQTVRQQLADVFTINGKFDEQLFNERVFYTNAYGSLNTRMGQETKTPYGSFMLDDKDTGVPQLEKALEYFLTSDDRDVEAIAAFIPKLATIYTIVKTKVIEELQQYRNGVTKAQENMEKLDESIEQVQKILDAVEEKCKNTAGELVREVKMLYDNYVVSVESGWDAHFSDTSVLSGIKFNSWDMIRLATTKNEELKKKKMEPIQKAIETYVSSKSATLQSGIQDVITVKMNDLEHSLKNYQEQLDKLDCPIDMDQILRNLMSIVDTKDVSAGEVKANPFKLILGLVGGDPDIAMDAFDGSVSNTQAIIKAIGVNLFEYIALYIVAWPIGLAMLGKRVWDMIAGWKSGGQNSARELLKGIKPDIIQGLREGKSALVVDMEKKVGGAIIRAGRTFSTSFMEELESYKKSYEEVVKNLNDKNFDLNEEVERTRGLLTEMARCISHINQTTRGKGLNEKEILALAEGKSQK